MIFFVKAWTFQFLNIFSNARSFYNFFHNLWLFLKFVNIFVKIDEFINKSVNAWAGQTGARWEPCSRLVGQRSKRILFFSIYFFILCCYCCLGARIDLHGSMWLKAACFCAPYIINHNKVPGIMILTKMYLKLKLI